jgi:hypothetical protein
MPPSGRLQVLRTRDSNDSPTFLNIPVIALILAFSLLLVVCIGICCCSYQKTAKRNERYPQRGDRADQDGVGFNQLNSSLTYDLSSEGQVTAEAKLANWAGINEPPAYSSVNPAMLASPQIPQSESERLLPPTPITPRAPSPPPPTYNAVR